jgi:KaiC/GvpD/RAD55 family RecA-like ATPase
MVEILKDKKEMKRVKTYIKGLDENIEGGIPAGHVVLVSGTAGTMKSSVIFNILYNEALAGKTSLYLSLEQSYQSLLNHFINMGYDFSKINLYMLSDISKIDESIAEVKASKKGTLIISDVGTLRKQIKNLKVGPGGDWLNVIKNIVQKIKKGCNCELFTLDSLSAMYILSNFTGTEVRSRLFYVFEFLRDLGLTSFLISEMPLTKTKYSEYEIEDFLSDGIIVLQLTERYRKVTREISIVKMRATKCNTDIFSLEFKDGQFQALYGGKTPLV